MAEYLLVHYGEDDSVSVLKSNSKQVLEYSGNFVKVKWPRLGVFDGTILEKSSECNKHLKGQPSLFEYVLYCVNL